MLKIFFRPKSLPCKTLQESENILFEKSQPFRYIQDTVKIYRRTDSRDAHRSIGGSDVEHGQ
jgi:hypothetical protein